MADIVVTLAATWLAATMLAPCGGSLRGVLIRRLPAGRPVALARAVGA
ncbi:MAG TPA: hypothetical protein VNE67_03530 [Acetobacteraceae bacterium]|nr:hypothetical protein [Acetobacteraceae bacterium]